MEKICISAVIAANQQKVWDYYTLPEHIERMAKMNFATVNPLYLHKIEKKGRTKEELHQVISWLTGFDDKTIDRLLKEQASFDSFFKQSRLHPNAALIKGLICGYRIEELEHPLTRNIRYLDKLVDELAKGKKMEKILRT